MTMNMTSKLPEPRRMSELSPLSAIQLMAEKKIAQAQEEGQFDNLPGSGRPLELEDMSGVPEELRMAYKVLKNAGCLPPELQERKDISRLVDLLEHCQDEKEKLRQMHRLRFMIERSRMRFGRNLHLEAADQYYEDILRRLAKLENMP